MKGGAFILAFRSGARLLFIGAICALSGCAAYGPARQGEAVHPNLVYARRGGQPLGLDLFVPQRAHAVPVVVWIHGGSWSWGYRGFRVLVRDLTRHGIAVASIDYRHVPEHWPAQIDDCAEAVRWLRANGARYRIDPKRIGVSGDSAGGHLASLLGVVEGRSRVRAVCALYPPTDMILIARKNAHYGKHSVFFRLFDGMIEERLPVARDASPLHRIRGDAPPFLFIHGTNDKLVPPVHSVAMHRALRQHGIPSELILVRGRGHAFSLNDAQFARVAAFFQRHL